MLRTRLGATGLLLLLVFACSSDPRLQSLERMEAIVLALEQADPATIDPRLAGTLLGEFAGLSASLDVGESPLGEDQRQRAASLGLRFMEASVRLVHPPLAP